MTGFLTGKWKLWVIGGLLAALAVAMWQWRAEIRNAAQWAVGFGQLEQVVREQEARLDRERRRWEETEALRLDLQSELQSIREEQRQITREFRELERNDEEVAEWAGRRLPGALTDWVLNDRAQGGNAERDRVPDTAGGVDE